MEANQKNIFGWIAWAGGRRLISSVSTFQGKTGLDIRVHYFDPETEEWRPTKQGIRVPIEKAKDFHELIMQAYARLSSHDDIAHPSENGVHPPHPSKEEEPRQSSADHADFYEDDPETENSESLKHDTDDDPEKQMNDWLRDK